MHVSRHVCVRVRARLLALVGERVCACMCRRVSESVCVRAIVRVRLRVSAWVRLCCVRVRAGLCVCVCVAASKVVGVHLSAVACVRARVPSSVRMCVWSHFHRIASSRVYVFDVCVCSERGAVMSPARTCGIHSSACDARRAAAHRPVKLTRVRPQV